MHSYSSRLFSYHIYDVFRPFDFLPDFLSGRLTFFRGLNVLPVLGGKRVDSCLLKFLYYAINKGFICPSFVPPPFFFLYFDQFCPLFVLCFFLLVSSFLFIFTFWYSLTPISYFYPYIPVFAASLFPIPALLMDPSMYFSNSRYSNTW